jgi:YfiH family protein
MRPLESLWVAALQDAEKLKSFHSEPAQCGFSRRGSNSGILKTALKPRTRIIGSVAGSTKTGKHFMARPIKTRSARRAAAAQNIGGPARNEDHGWIVRRRDELQILQSRSLADLDWLVHGFSTRPGGKSELDGKASLNLGFTDWDQRPRVAENRTAFMAALSARDMSLVALRQFHSDVIHCAMPTLPEESNASTLKAEAPQGDAPKADASMTCTPGLLLGVQTADCVPILLADTRQHVVAAIHAGWRGTLARIAVKTLGRMRMEFGTRARDVVAALGPAIGRCCYEVGPEVAQAFATQFPVAADWFDGPFEQLAHGEEPLWLPWLTMMPPGHVPPPPRVQLDLRASNRWQLIDAGVPEAHIDVSDLCTACRPDLLFSYRGEGAKTGRMMAAIGIRA